MNAHYRTSIMLSTKINRIFFKDLKQVIVLEHSGRYRYRLW